MFLHAETNRASVLMFLISSLEFYSRKAETMYTTDQLRPLRRAYKIRNAFRFDSDRTNSPNYFYFIFFLSFVIRFVEWMNSIDKFDVFFFFDHFGNANKTEFLEEKKIEQLQLNFGDNVNLQTVNLFSFLFFVVSLARTLLLFCLFRWLLFFCEEFLSIDIN